MSIKRITYSASETEAFAEELAKGLIIHFAGKNNVILLLGEVGAGKTTFVRGFMQNWGLSDITQSPTFTVMNIYENDAVRVCHFDLYRLNSPSELADIGLEDSIAGSDFSILEWPEIALPLLDFPVYKIRIEPGQTEAERIFEIEVPL